MLTSVKVLTFQPAVFILQKMRYSIVGTLRRIRGLKRQYQGTRPAHIRQMDLRLVVLQGVLRLIVLWTPI